MGIIWWLLAFKTIRCAIFLCRFVYGWVGTRLTKKWKGYSPSPHHRQTGFCQFSFSFCAHSHKCAFIYIFRISDDTSTTNNTPNKPLSTVFSIRAVALLAVADFQMKRFYYTAHLNPWTQLLTFWSEMAAFKHQKCGAQWAGRAFKTDLPRNKWACEGFHQKRSGWQEEEPEKEKGREKSPSADSELTFLLSFVLWSLFLLLGDGLRHFPVA